MRTAQPKQANEVDRRKDLTRIVHEGDLWPMSRILLLSAFGLERDSTDLRAKSQVRVPSSRAESAHTPSVPAAKRGRSGVCGRCAAGVH